MDVGVIIAIVIAALVLIAIFAWLGRRKREERFEERRVEAHEHREQAALRSARADRASAEAEERAARARREQAIAEEQAATARRERRHADETAAEADRIDPDTDATRDARTDETRFADDGRTERYETRSRETTES
jgi:FtsZ-interacting cell division protein ZipA